MNIAEAKKQIKNAMTAYFTKDAYGAYCIPAQAQRPVFLMGPPGVGKTAVIEQIAQEMGVGLISYSMTHHTRQSALGLPYIVKKTYGGKEYSVSEYTMSEIIAAVYDQMADSGVKEGILFLDEINCVSETLTPAMLQFLQYKVFGRHKVPDGWIVVTAGNPPEYNRSAREFDIVTWDRLKRIDIEPDLDAWKEFAYKKGVHPAVMTYLEAKKDHFYMVESTVEGKRFATARGWDDLSEMIKLYEKHDIHVNQQLIEQYIQNTEIAQAFANYYDLFNKYKADYKIDAILGGGAPQDIKERAAAADFDERLSLLGLLLDAVNCRMKAVVETEETLKRMLPFLRALKTAEDVENALTLQLEGLKDEREKKAHRISISESDRNFYACITSFLNAEKRKKVGFADIKADFDAKVSELNESATAAGNILKNIFDFVEEVFSDGNEMLVFLAELTANYFAVAFISRYGCEAYYRHNEKLMFYERQKEIIKAMDSLEWKA